jgi:anti-sigma factor RsiW
MKGRGRWLEQIHRYAEGQLPAEELKALEAELRRDPALRRDFIEYLNLDAALEDYAVGFVPEHETKEPKIVEPGWSFWRPRVWAVAAAVAVLVGGGLWLSLRSDGAQVAVEVVSSEGVRALDRRFAPVTGQKTEISRLQLTAGSLSLKLDSEVQLDFSGAVDVEFLSPMRVRLNRGQLTAEVGERGKGFTVETVRGTVVDLGTRFGVEVGLYGTMDVVVFDGTVEVHETDTQRKTEWPLASLKAGEALRLAKPRDVSRLQSVFMSTDDWSTHAPALSSIGDVRDNFIGTDARRFYRVWVGGMTPGAQARHTRRPKWFPTEGDRFPEWLQGADLVETFPEDMHNTALRLTVTLQKPSVVYVFQDLRQSPPRWLRRQFTDTGVRLRLERADTPEDVPPTATTKPFAVWKSEPLPPGVLTLGPRRDPDQPVPGRMYGIAARAIPETVSAPATSR